jgi:hypothetical protein
MISRMTDEQIIERFEENERAIAEYKKQLDALREDFKTLLWYSAPGDLALKQVKNRADGDLTSDAPAVVKRCQEFVERHR